MRHKNHVMNGACHGLPACTPSPLHHSAWPLLVPASFVCAVRAFHLCFLLHHVRSTLHQSRWCMTARVLACSAWIRGADRFELLALLFLPGCLAALERMCMLIFDEIVLKKNLTYDPAHDVVHGFTDDGVERTSTLQIEPWLLCCLKFPGGAFSPLRYWSVHTSITSSV